MDFRFHTKVHVMLLDRYVKGVGKKMNHFVMVCKVKEKVSASHRKDKLAARTFQKQRLMHTHNSKWQHQLRQIDTERSHSSSKSWSSSSSVSVSNESD